MQSSMPAPSVPQSDLPLVGQAQGRAAQRFHRDPACPHCAVALDRQQYNDGVQSCLACGKPFEAAFFDPPPLPSRVVQLVEAGPQGGHPCSAHVGNLATTHCSRCGVFMCHLCRIEIEGTELCPTCYPRQRQNGELISMRMDVPDFAGHTLSMGILTALLFVFGIVLGPITWWMGRKALKQAKEIGDTSGRTRIYIGLALGTLGFAGCVAMLAAMILPAMV